MKPNYKRHPYIVMRNTLRETYSYTTLVRARPKSQGTIITDAHFPEAQFFLGGMGASREFTKPPFYLAEAP